MFELTLDGPPSLIERGGQIQNVGTCATIVDLTKVFDIHTICPFMNISDTFLAFIL